MERNKYYNKEWLKTYSSHEFEEKYTYDGKDLGITFNGKEIVCKMWSPYAKRVTVLLFNSGDFTNEDLIDEIEMVREEKGIFSAQIDKKFENKYYQYKLEFEEYTIVTIDPYAKSAGVNGTRGMILDLSKTNPAGWEDDKNPNHGMPVTDMMIYELHVRDFSSDKNSGIKNKGKFKGVVEKGSTVPGTKIKTGIDYLKELGITHIHFLPIYDYCTVDEAKEYDENEYNWGYDPANYNLPEGSYSTNAFDGSVRVKELKEMIQELHKNGISVIMDVVYNHTFNENFPFNRTVPGYFHRIDENIDFSNGSACGNDTASERAMVRKFIVDSVVYWAKEYHIDGFRFDLLGLLDVETMNQIRKEINEFDSDIMMYGEGWNLATKLTKDNVELATQLATSHMDRIAMFSDNMRDAVKGSVFEKDEKGYISGNEKCLEELLAGIKGAPSWAENPIDVINYTSCHDNYTLFDKIQLCNNDISFEDGVKQNKLAFSIVMLSEGIPLMHAGEEILRTKVDENGEFVSDSVCSPDSVNSIKWGELKKDEYRKCYEYYKGLIAFRKAHNLLRLDSASKVEKAFELLSDKNDMCIEYSLSDNDEEIVVIFNPLNEEKLVKLPEGEFNCYVNGEQAGTDVIQTESGETRVNAFSCKVFVKK